MQGYPCQKSSRQNKTKDIENYNEKVSSFQSYLDKLESGTFSPVDKEALAEEFNIIADTTDKYIDKINAKIQKQKFNILSVMDEIIAKGKADGSIGDVELRKLDKYKVILRDIADVSLDKGIKFDLTGNPLENIQKLSDGLDQLYIRCLNIANYIYKQNLSITVCGMVFTQSINFVTAALISSRQLKKTLLITEFLSQPHSSSILLRFGLYGGRKTSSRRSLFSSRKSCSSFA